MKARPIHITLISFDLPFYAFTNMVKCPTVNRQHNIWNINQLSSYTLHTKRPINQRTHTLTHEMCFE